jgi:hypothetical protein
MTGAAHTPWESSDVGAYCDFDGTGVVVLTDDRRVAAFHRADEAERACLCVNALEGIPDPSVVGEAIAMLHDAARWFEDYARSHYQQAKNAPSYGEQHGREVKGKLNQERCDAILAVLAKLDGSAS